ncbi:MAG: hypothetical protein EPN38_09655 [Rhodanobacteraceae bacterium]|nr:MAG: hypothetical protein EPN38_09655 [Rhodanobacteraceae bacterium]
MVTQTPGCRTAIAKPGWFGRILRLVVGALLAWSGVNALRQADWLLPGLCIAVAMPLAQTLGILAFEARGKHRTTLSVAQVRLWIRVYVIAVLVAVALLRNLDAAVGTVAFAFGWAMALAAVCRYGGCEVMAVPNLLLRRNYVAFCCLFSPVDELEQKAAAWWSKRRRRA